MAGRDITEGRSARSIAVDLGVVSASSTWENTGVFYDTAVGGIPFFYAINDNRPYVRQTAPFRKEQFDNGNEPGEQSLTGWWIRSQSSFHNGTGINFYDPSAGETVNYRFKDSKGINIWTKGQVTLLKNTTPGHEITGTIASNGRSQQQLRSIKYDSTNAVLLHDEYDVDKITSSSTTPVHFIDYNSGSDYPVYGICDDGTNAYWVTNVLNTGTPRLRVYSKPLTGTSSTTATLMISDNGITVSNAVMEYVKDRIVMCVNNKIYEFSTSAAALPTALYTHSDTDVVFTSVTASGPAIYISGYSGIQSFIFKFTLNTSGVMPTLTTAITAAEMPVGEKIHKIYYYLGYMLIGTSKGIRVATVNDQDGSLSYGPLIVATSQPCYDFAARDKYVWCATSVGGEPGVIRIDLTAQIEPLRFAYANDVYYSGVTGHETTSCAFLGETDRLAFCSLKASSVNGNIYTEDESTLTSSGYLQTGFIRYATLEPKNFRRVIGRGVFTKGSMTVSTVTEDGTEYEHTSYDSSVPSQEVATTQPEEAQEFVGFKFTLYRDSTTTSDGPTFKGYQVKSTIATPRQRILKFPVFCYDVEADKFNVMNGYEGRAVDKIKLLEDAEAYGDVLVWQDFTTDEYRQVVIEQLSFTRLTPPDKRFSGFGGVIDITLRTV